MGDRGRADLRGSAAQAGETWFTMRLIWFLYLEDSQGLSCDESVGLWGFRLLVGCMDGSLRMCAPEFKDNLAAFKESDLSAASYIFKNTGIGFAKKAVTSMNVLQSRSLLISLSDAVAIHSLPEFDVVEYLTKTRVQIYVHGMSGEIHCVAVAKRLFIYKSVVVYGQYLFEQHKYVEAMEHFGAHLLIFPQFYLY